MHEHVPLIDAAEVRALLLARSEVALLDVREEDPFAQEHPLWAANLPLSRLEPDAWRRIPRRDVPVVVYGVHAGHDLAPVAARRLRDLGYVDVRELDGGLAGWVAAGGEVFRDVNVPSKAFGELVESVRDTPSLSAREVQERLAASSPVVIDVRRPDEYRAMSIPTAVSLPGGEAVLRIRELAPDPTTPIIVNCAGRTRSIIGTQSLINAGVPNPVVALRNGTIGWTLAGQELEHGAVLTGAPVVAPEHLRAARSGARDVADRAGVRRIGPDAVASLVDPTRTTYFLDVRTEEEYVRGHLPGFRHVPGGQLVQETDHVAPVRGARLVLADDDGVRASMTGSWLAQMGWETYVVDPGGDLTEHGHPAPHRPRPPSVDEVTPDVLAGWIDHGDAVVVDVGPGRGFARGHVPGAWFAIRAQLEPALAGLPAGRLVLTSPDDELARWAASDVQAAGRDVVVLAGGTDAWSSAGHDLDTGLDRLLTPVTDRYRRPYEGVDNHHDAMQAYLDWELGLIAQLDRDATHFFHVV